LNERRAEIGPDVIPHVRAFVLDVDYAGSLKATE
jgi:hypothetical protein